MVTGTHVPKQKRQKVLTAELQTGTTGSIATSTSPGIN